MTTSSKVFIQIDERKTTLTNCILRANLQNVDSLDRMLSTLIIRLAVNSAQWYAQLTHGSPMICWLRLWIRASIQIRTELQELGQQILFDPSYLQFQCTMKCDVTVEWYVMRWEVPRHSIKTLFTKPMIRKGLSFREISNKLANTWLA